MEIVPNTVQAVWSWLSHKQYAGWADTYDGTLERLYYMTPTRVAAVLTEQFSPEARLLELGAGTGLVGAALEALESPLRLTGTDLCRPMLEQIKSGAYKETFVMDASRPLPFPPDSFDGVLSAGLLEYIVDPGMLLDNVLGVLAPGGKVLMTYAPAEHQAVEQIELEMILLRHHPQSIAWHLANHGLTPVYEESVEAYWNRGVQIIHNLVVATRSEQEG